MARLFDNAQNEYLQIESAVVAAAPFTMACWFYPLNITANMSLMWLGDKDVAADFWQMVMRGGDLGDPLRFAVLDTNPTSADTTNSVVANTWQHGCVREKASNDRDVILAGDFGNDGTDNAERTPDNADRTSCGMARDSTPGAAFSGRIAWPAIWNVALSDDEVVSLAAGTHPMRIRPADLVAFWPLGGLDPQHDRDIWGGYDMTAFSDAAGPAWADHPGGLIYPSPPQVSVPAAAGPPPGVIMNQLQGANLGADLYNGTMLVG